MLAWRCAAAGHMMSAAAAPIQPTLHLFQRAHFEQRHVCRWVPEPLLGFDLLEGGEFVVFSRVIYTYWLATSKIEQNFFEKRRTL